MDKEKAESIVGCLLMLVDLYKEGSVTREEVVSNFRDTFGLSE